jgi:hypothetical protein
MKFCGAPTFPTTKNFVVTFVLASMTVACGVKVEGAVASRTSDFLNSLGTMSAISTRGETLQKTIDSVTFLGVRWMRAGIEGNIPIEQFVELHQKTGVRFSWGFGSGRSDLPRLLETARQIEAVGALLAFEGPNEPNNWGITYQSETGGRNGSWLAVAKLQEDLYKAVKADAVLKKYPVWSISEGGAERDNVGLQFLTIPEGAGTVSPAGTRFADYANVHNYIYHPNSSGLEDNKTWNAADPGPGCRVDGLYGEYAVTWARKFQGYSTNELQTLPRVTTETGATIDGAITEEIHALNLLSMYLDQFRRGWRYTAVYLLRDRVDEGGNQKFGFFRPDYTPRKAALHLHNLTTILIDRGALAIPETLDYAIANQPATVHDMLLQRSDRAFQLLVWDERLKGSDDITIRLGATWTVIRIYDPTIGVTAIKSVENTDSIHLRLSDHPVVIELAPGSK